MSIDKYKITKKLGSGVYGTTYLVKKNNIKYALKIEKILNKEIKEDSSSPVWRDIYFAKYFGNLYPDHFMKIHEYDIIDNCKHEQIYPEYIKYYNKKLQDSLSERIQSNFCSRKIYSLIDSPLKDIIPRLKNQNEIYSIIIQICYIIYLMNKHNYTHNDINNDNIGVIYTNKDKHLKIFNEDIPTYGYQLNLIDYGYVLHDKFNFTERPEMGLPENEVHEKSMKDELKKTLSKLLVDQSNFNKTFDKMTINWNKIYTDFYETNKGKILQSITTNKTDLFNLYMMINPLNWEKLILGENFKTYIPIHKLLQTDDLVFILQNTPIDKPEDIEKITRYFIMKLNL
jgi:hypothetical protein